MPIHNTSSLVCPVCKDSLIKHDDNLLCQCCKLKYPVINGIPNFINKEIFWGEKGISEITMRNILEELSSKNWHDVFSRHPSEAVRNHYFFISNPDRAKWHEMLNLDPQSIILDLGAGMGTISQALSKCYKHIYALEPVEARCEFMKQRFQQEGIHNVTIIRADSTMLPFPSGHFDHIILNGVLEWFPYSYKNMNPRKAQLFVLKNLMKLLKPNGSISVGIENRLHYANFLGAPDCHIEIKYVTILPRFLAHIVCKIRLKDIYRPYLYSWLGLKRLLREAGFSNVTVYSSLPCYNEPRYTICLDSHSDKFDEYIWVTKNRPSLIVKRILNRFNILKYIGYAFRVTAIKK